MKAAYSVQAKQHLKEFLARAEPSRFARVDSPKVSILLVFFNQAHLSLLCLESIIEHASEVEVIIVDNHSTDETAQLLNLISGAKLIKNQDNLGFVKAVNQGAALAGAEHILLLNNDTRLEQGAIEYANETLESGEDIGAVGGKILLLDGSLQEAGSLIWQDGSCLGYGRGEDPEQPEYMFRRDVDYCSGAFLLFRKQDFIALNGFDEQFAPAYYEESDFCVRLRKSGKRVVYDPRAIITHFEFASTGGINKASELQLAHRQLFCQKHSDFLSQFYDHTRCSPLQARSPTGLHNVLVIDDRVPYPSMGSGYPRSCHLLQTLLAMPVRLTFYPLQFPHDDWQEIYAQIGMDFEVMLDHGRERLLEFLQSRIGFFDCIIVSRDHNMDFFNQAAMLDPRIAQHTRIIYDAEALIAPRKIMHRRLMGETVSEAEAISAIKQEVHKARLADAVIAVSEHEADYFRSYENKTTVVAGHAIRPRRTENVFASRKDLLFVGALREDDSPNVDSLVWFMEQCWPAIRTAEPETKLVVVGDNTAPALNGINDKRIVFRGRQASIESFYDTCRFSLRRHASLLEFPTKSTRRLPMDFRQSSPHCWQVSSTGLTTANYWLQKAENSLPSNVCVFIEALSCGPNFKKAAFVPPAGIAQKRHSVRQFFRRSNRQRNPRKLERATQKYLASRNSRICSRPDRTLTHPSSCNPRRWRRLSASP